jgi:phosphotransferase system enzyme I (PtsI)
LEKEANPFLGYRAIRLCLDNLNIFKTQLRAILRASHYGNLSIMFPMISSIEELREAKKILEECKIELEHENVPYKKDIKVGIMIEIPSAALISYTLAQECDFFSIGTNDLIQYTVAVERGNEKIARLYTKYHPAVIKLIKESIDGAHDSGIFCGMCGEAAGDELLIPLLIGFGLDEFSMNSNSILKARKIINCLEKKKCEELVKDVLNLSSAQDVENKLKKFIENIKE